MGFGINGFRPPPLALRLMSMQLAGFFEPSNLLANAIVHVFAGPMGCLHRENQERPIDGFRLEPAPSLFGALKFGLVESENETQLLQEIGIANALSIGVIFSRWQILSMRAQTSAVGMLPTKVSGTLSGPLRLALTGLFSRCAVLLAFPIKDSHPKDQRGVQAVHPVVSRPHCPGLLPCYHSFRDRKVPNPLLPRARKEPPGASTFVGGRTRTKPPGGEPGGEKLFGP